jgi:hypothetical protein
VSNLIPEGAGIVVGVGVGAAASAAIEPAVEIPKQEAWNRNRNKLLDAGLMARLVAQGAISLEVGRNSAGREGFTDDKFDHLVYLAQTVPGFSEALSLWRRKLLSQPLFEHVLAKLGLDARYVKPIVDSKLAEILGIGDIAYGVVRGILPAPAWVPVAPPVSGDKVKRFPQVDIDPLVLAEKLGYDEDMLKLAVGRSGLSMAPVMAANALFRQIIGPDDFLLAIAEGDLRTEWAEAVREASREILTAGQYAELQLRGFYDEPTRRLNTRKHGMTDTDSDLLYNVLGRSVNVHQVTTGLARGGTYPSKYADVPQPYRAAIQRSNIREEWVGIAYANRYSYPSWFALRSLLTDGVFTETEAAQLLKELGWRPDLADKVAKHYAPTGATATDAHVGKAQTQLWGTLHRSYIAGESTKTAARPVLASLGLATASQDAVLALWDAERALVRKQLTPAQIKKAYVKGIKNQATGATWTRDDALAALIERGYAPPEANEFLDL